MSPPPTVVFAPPTTRCDVDANTKLLVAATRNKVKIRYGCASCRCGTCGVAVTPEAGAQLSVMREDERKLLKRMGLNSDGSVRLACQTRIISGVVAVDLAFQNTYSPDQLDGADDE